ANWPSSIPSVLCNTGEAGAATRATETGRSLSSSYIANCRSRNPGACTTSSRGWDSKVRRQTGCRLFGEPLAEAFGLPRNQMRETFTSGSVGRAPGNRCLYPEGDGCQRPLVPRCAPRQLKPYPRESGWESEECPK